MVQMSAKSMERKSRLTALKDRLLPGTDGVGTDGVRLDLEPMGTDGNRWGRTDGVEPMGSDSIDSGCLSRYSKLYQIDR